MLMVQVALFFFVFTKAVSANMEKPDKAILNMALSCHTEVVQALNKLISTGTLTPSQLFDTFYIPIPGTNPQKYHTQYDKYTDEYLQPILDKYLKHKVIFVIAVDVNGYVPTHNSKYSQESIGISSMDVSWNRTKRIFNDRTGLAAARNTKSYLLQSYQRDTGETIYDYSLPVFIHGKHWGAIRVGYK